MSSTAEAGLLLAVALLICTIAFLLLIRRDIRHEPIIAAPPAHQRGLCSRCRRNRATRSDGRCDACRDIQLDIAQAIVRETGRS